MINIMCFGDSNTYGVDPVTGNRLERYQRWPGILQKILGEEYYIIEEGLGGRTTVWEDPLAEDRNGIKSLKMLLDSHSPLDWVILMLGTNDLKYHFSALPTDVAAGMEKLVVTILHHVYKENEHPPKILLLSPIWLGEGVENSKFPGFCQSAVEYSKKLPGFYEAVAKKYDCKFLAAHTIVQADRADWIHMNREEHEKLAKRIAEVLRTEL